MDSAGSRSDVPRMSGHIYWFSMDATDLDRRLGSSDQQRIIKDQYQAEGRRFNEGELFDILQKDLPNNRAPGCVHVEHHGAVGIQTPIAATQRQRMRMVMTTFGKSLYDCPSVFDLLKVMYDALEGATSLISIRFSDKS
jgi:hypothetical protein